MRSRFLFTVAIPTLVAGLSLTACSAGSSGGTAAASATPVAGQSAAAGSASPTVGTTASALSAAIQADKCRTQNLKWTLTYLTNLDVNAKDPANAELVAVNSGSHSCTLAGFPKLEFHQGKGPQAHGVGKGTPAPVTLGAGKKAVIALRYTEINGKGPNSDNCNPARVTAGSAEVTAPGDSSEAHVPVVDQSGKPAEISVCGDEVRMSAPVAR